MFRNLTDIEQAQLIAQGCSAKNWREVWVKDGFDAAFVRDVQFSGTVKMGVFNREFALPGGLSVHAGIQHAMLHNCEIGDNVHLENCIVESHGTINPNTCYCGEDGVMIVKEKNVRYVI